SPNTKGARLSPRALFLVASSGVNLSILLSIPPAVIPFIPEAIHAMVAVWSVISVRAVHRSNINRRGLVVIPRPRINRIRSPVAAINIKTRMRRSGSRSEKSQKSSQRHSRQRRFPNDFLCLHKDRVHDLLPHSGLSNQPSRY